MWDVIFDSLFDALKDGAILLPFLLLAFLIIEGTEHHTRGWLTKFATNGKKTGPIWGSLLGLIPQCGFSVMGANMYAGGIITIGTLMAIFLSTSDEAIILMVTEPGAIGKILPLLLCKFIIGLVFGFAIDFARKLKYKNKAVGTVEHHHEPHDLCENCGCNKYPGIVRPALYHTAKLFIFIFIITFVLNLLFGFIGSERLSTFLLSGSIFQPFLTALIGLIPNCAASVLITELYISGGISFASAVAGLCAGAGIGLAVLFRMHSCTKKNIGIVAMLYAISVFCGVVISIFGF